MPLKKLLSEYFQKPELQQACFDIDEPTSYSSDELITIILKEWKNKGRNKYELFEYLDKPKLSRICKAYKLDHKGSKKELVKRIKKAKLLENDKKRLTIRIGGSVGAIAAVLILIDVLDFGIGTFDFIESRWIPFSDSNQTEYSDISIDPSQYFLAVAMQTIESLNRYIDTLEKQILESDDENERRKLEQIQERIELGNFHYDDGNYDNARDYYKLVLENESNNPEALDGYALMLAILGELEESIMQYDKLLILKPGYYVAMLNNAWSHILLENYPEALGLLDELENKNSEDPLVISHKCWLMEKMDELTETINYCTKALDNDQNDIRAIKAYSLSLSIIGNYTQALPYHERLYTMYPDDDATIINYATTLAHSDNVQLALELYDYILDKYPNQPDVTKVKRSLCLQHPELVCGVI